MSWLLNLFNSSKSSIYNEQDNDAFITQNYSGTCKIACNNDIHGVDINVVNSNIVGGLTVSQKCDVDGQCYFSTTQDATANIISKANNSSNAKNVETGIGNSDYSSIDNRQYNKIAVNQAISQKCDEETFNDITDMNVYVGNSNIQGGVAILQSGNLKGNCTMNSNMKAVALASSIADNKSMSGKDKKGEFCGNKGSKFAMIAGIVGFIVLLLIVFVIAKVITRKKGNGSSNSSIQMTSPSSNNITPAYNPPSIVSSGYGEDT
jgi:hypothetical protein